MTLLGSLLSRSTIPGRRLDPPLPEQPDGLPSTLAEIALLHALAESELDKYQAATEANLSAACKQYQAAIQERIKAAEMKHLPAAIYAAQLAEAERHCVRTTLETTMKRLDALGADVVDSLDLATAIAPLRKLLAVLPSTDVCTNMGVKS
jgi:hypothetical protein